MQENFHRLKDELVLYKDRRSIENGCFSCKALNHTFKNCPLIHFIPDRELVLKRHLSNKPHIHRLHYIRRKRISFQTLYNHRRLEVLRLKLLDLFLFSSGSFSNYDKLLQSSVDWFGNSRISEEGSAEIASSSSMVRSDLTSSWVKGKESLLESSQKRSDRKGAGAFREAVDEDNNDRERDKEKIDPDTILRSLKLSREYKPAVETVQGHVIEDTDNTLKASGFNMKQKDLDIDRMYNFKVYFPHNNCEKVINYITKRRRKILKKRSSSNKTKQKRIKDDQAISISFRFRDKYQQANNSGRVNFLPVPLAPKNRGNKSLKLVHFQKENIF
jgi:hypothetical protein